MYSWIKKWSNIKVDTSAALLVQIDKIIYTKHFGQYKLVFLTNYYKDSLNWQYFFSEEIDSLLKISKIDLNMFESDTSAIYEHKL